MKEKRERGKQRKKKEGRKQKGRQKEGGKKRKKIAGGNGRKNERGFIFPTDNPTKK